MPMDVVRDASGMEKIILREPGGSSVQVQLYGGKITSWKNDHGDELLFLSRKGLLQPPKSVRGGIAHCFHQCGNFGSLEQQGFLQNCFWTIDSSPPSSPSLPIQANKSYVDLIFRPSHEDLKIWPYQFEFRLRVTLGASTLTLSTRVRNTDTKAFIFKYAMLTYFSVSDISEVRVEGLETLDYLDNLNHRKRYTEQGDAITFDGEVDRSYLSTPTKMAIIDHEKKRSFVVRKEGLPDAVVWNPWEKKSKAMRDMDDEDYKQMVCIGSAAIEKAITLRPGQEWKGRQEISAVLSSYYSGQLDPLLVLNG